MKTLKETVLSARSYIASMLVVSASLFTFAIGAELEGKENCKQFNVSIQLGRLRSIVLEVSIRVPNKRLQLFQTRA